VVLYAECLQLRRQLGRTILQIWSEDSGLGRSSSQRRLDNLFSCAIIHWKIIAQLHKHRNWKKKKHDQRVLTLYEGKRKIDTEEALLRWWKLRGCSSQFCKGFLLMHAFFVHIPDFVLRRSFSICWQGFLDFRSKVLVDVFAKCALAAFQALPHLRNMM